MLPCTAPGPLSPSSFGHKPAPRFHKSWGMMVPCFAMALTLCGWAQNAFGFAKAATTTTLSVTSGGTTVSTVASGTVVTLTATVTKGGSAMTPGQVRFCDGSAALCSDIHLLGTAQLSSAGKATFKFVPGPGAHNLKAVFVDNNFGVGSVSGVSALTVGQGKAPVYTNTTAIVDNGVPGDQSLTATVIGYGGTAPVTGNISFLDATFGNKSLSTVALGQSTAGLGWAISQTPAAGGSPFSEVVGDFNGDGIADLALAWNANGSYGTGSVTILFGKGNGSFTAGPTTSAKIVTESYTYMVAGDFNADGKTDLALLNSSAVVSSTITAFLGNGDGTFTVSSTSSAMNPSPANANYSQGTMVAADFNGDGKLDLAVTGMDIYSSGTSSSGAVSIALGNGDGTFSPMQPTVVPAQTLNSIATGDFNGDGIADLVAATYYSPATATILLGKGDGTFTALPTPLDLGTGHSFINSIVVGDFNRDGVLDLGIADGSVVETFRGTGDGTFSQFPGSPFTLSYDFRSLAVGDFNHDGTLDLAGIDNNNDQIILLLGAGDGTFTESLTNPPGSQLVGQSLTAVPADLNGDGVSDLSVLSRSQLTAAVLLGQPTSAATATANHLVLLGAGTHAVVASYAGNANYSPTVSSPVTLNAGLAPLVITPASGKYSSVQTVTITEAIPGATIYYSMSGANSTNDYVPYTGPIALTLGGSTSITAYATETGYNSTGYATVNYSLNLPVAPTPVISPAAGSYPGTQTVTITDAVPGATIYYSTDGNPLTTTYTGPITVSTSGIVSAAATASGYSVSNVAFAQYYINSSKSSFVYSVAGSQDRGFAGDGGPATAASLNFAQATIEDSAGNIYIADTNNNVVRKVNAGTGIITTVVGTGVAGYSGDNGKAINAQLFWPVGLAVDNAGDLYIAEEGNKVVRKVAAATGNITTFAGSATATTLGDGGPATSAQLTNPSGLALDSIGNLYISDITRVRKVAAGTGTITTIAGNGTPDYTGDNGPAINATLKYATGIAVDIAGNLFIADGQNGVIRKVTASTGIITTVAGKGPIQGGAPRFSGDGGPATQAQLSYPTAVAVNPAGDLFIADNLNFAVREVTASDGVIRTIAGSPEKNCYSPSGDGGAASATEICKPQSISLDAAGSLYIAESGWNRIRKITPPVLPPTTAAAEPVFSVSSGTYVNPQTVVITDATPGAAIYVTLNGTAPTTAGAGYRGKIDVTGNVTVQAIAVAPGYLPSKPVSATYVISTPPPTVANTVAGNGQTDGSGVSGPAIDAGLGDPTDVAFDSAANLYIADSKYNVVWRVDAATGTISIAAGTLDDTAGLNESGGPATKTNLFGLSHIAIDSADNLYTSEYRINRIRKISASTGIVSDYAGGGPCCSLGDGGPATSAFLNYPQGLTFDNAGNLYIADGGNNRVRMVSAGTGNIRTVAGGGTGTPANVGDGGLATSATVQNPRDVALDGQGNLFIAELNYGRVRKVTSTTGIITTFAGNGNEGGNGDGGPATAAEVAPFGLAFDRANNLYISDGTDSVRMVPAGGGTITRVAGNGYTGFYGDGGSATVAGLCGPNGMVFDKAGSLYIADECNYRVRQISATTLTATPKFSLPAGTYSGTQTVTISDASQGAVIYYTTNGSIPTTASSVYSGPITVSASQTVKAMALAPGSTASAVVSVAYVINGPAGTTITWAAPAPATYGTALSSVQLNATATVAGTFVYSPAAGTVLGVGQHTLQVTFTPTDTAHYTTATASVPFTVNPATPAMSAAASSLNPSLVSDAITLMASVTSPVGAPTGTVTFFDGATQMGSATLTAGIATYTTSALAAGTHSITAVYSGDANFAPSTSSALSQVVETFLVGPSSGGSSTATVSPGGQASYGLSLTPPSVGAAVTFAITGLPAGAKATFSPSSVPAGAGPTNVTLSITVPSSSAALPTDSPFHRGALPAVLGLVLLPFAGKLRKSSRRALWLAIVGLAGFATLGLSACGGGGGGGSTPPTPTSHSYTLTVTATSGSLTQSTKLTLTVE
jgi:hypothetical protein